MTSTTTPCMLPGCVPGGPGMVAQGSTKVLIGGLPAAYVGAMTAHTSCVAPIPSPVGSVKGPGNPKGSNPLLKTEQSPVKHAHFESLKPLCPACRVQNFDETHLRIGSVIREENDEVIEGTLRCPNPACGSVFPIIDGIPILVADLTHYLTQHAHEILWRHDLDHRLQSELGDALGPGVVYDTNRLISARMLMDITEISIPHGKRRPTTLLL